MHATYDPRLPPSSHLKLRQVELEAESLSAEQLRRCLLAAWSGWLLERHLVNQVLEPMDIQIDTRLRGYTPAEVCR